jgi:hypothetical protein
MTIIYILMNISNSQTYQTPLKLHFKVECPIMLFHSIIPKHGLCNGLQFILT